MFKQRKPLNIFGHCHFELTFDCFCFTQQPAHEKIGVIDSQWIIHQIVPSLGNQVSHCPLANVRKMDYVFIF